MYYAKYIKYKNKYLNLKYQLGGTFITPLIRREDVKELDSTIPEVSTVLEPEQNLKSLLIDNLVGIKVLKSDSIILAPLVEYNKKFRSNPINFYVYRDKSSDSNPEYVLCSLYNYYEILFELQKKNVKIRRCNIDEVGNVTLKLKDIIIPASSDTINFSDVITNLKENLVGIKIEEEKIKKIFTKKELPKKSVKELKESNEFKEFKEQNTIHYYRYKEKDISYILLSLYDYYEFLDILYEHIEIEEVKINDKGDVSIVEADDEVNRIYHLIHKPSIVKPQTIPLNIKRTEINFVTDLIKYLESYLFIFTDEQFILHTICMYNLFIGTIHVYAIYIDNLQSAYFLLSLFTQHELYQKGISKPVNVKLKEGRLYKQGDTIEFKLNENFVGMMFNIYDRLKKEGHYANKLYRGNLAIDNKFLNELDCELLKKCRECISVKDIAFNTTLCLLPDKMGAKDHKDILEMEKDFLKNSFELINSNEKLYLWRYNYENLIQLWEYSLEDLGIEVDKFKKELLRLEPCHKELLVLKLKEKGFDGDTMEEILQNSALCYIDDKKDKEYKNKRLLYQHPYHKDESMEFVKKCKFIPEMKKLLEDPYKNNLETELNKYRQTILFKGIGSNYEIKFMENRKYFFANSWYWENKFLNITYDKTFKPFEWSAKLNKLTFQCLALRDMIIFPIRIINVEHLKYTLSYEFDISKQEFCGYLHTRFTDNYNNNFNIECRDKLYFIYSYTDHTRNFSGKDYRLYYYTGNPIWFEISILPYYQVYICEINWIYYTFILKNKTIPHFYEYVNDFGEKEILVSRFSLEQINKIYLENDYDICELELLKKEVYYNFNYYKQNNLTDKIFVDNPLLKTDEEQKKFINDVFRKNKIRVK